MIVLYPCTNDLRTASTTTVGFFMPNDRGAQQFFIILESVRCLAMVCALFCLFFMLTLAFGPWQERKTAEWLWVEQYGQEQRPFPVTSSESLAINSRQNGSREQ